jgi:hypothetical protein
VHGLVLATTNEKDFARFKGLTVENWSKRQVIRLRQRTGTAGG